MNTKKLTIFAVPKPFEGHTAIIQRNAIKSWSLLSNELEVILMGDDAGVPEIAKEFSLKHVPHLKKNQSGTPLLDSVFETAHRESNAPLLMYVNSDIILTSSILQFVDSIKRLAIQEFLAIGMRQDFEQESLIDFDKDWESKITNVAVQNGELASILCKDYFIFSNSQYRKIPAFSIGRGNWDSWMVATASKSGTPVIDATNHIFAGHQNHDYGHVGGRMQAYITGDEAKGNIKLAGGTHYIRGSVPTHRINDSGQLKRVNRITLLPIVRDFPRIIKQLVSFVAPAKARVETPKRTAA